MFQSLNFIIGMSHEVEQRNLLWLDYSGRVEDGLY